MAATLRAMPASSTPVPRPVTLATGRPLSAATIADDGVVLPIPMSPVATRSSPASISASTTSTPACSAAAPAPALIAGPRVRSAVPQATLRCTSPGVSPKSYATPTSTTATRAPACRVRTLIAAPPRRKLSTICGVTSLGYALTPFRTTPWSPAITIRPSRGTRGRDCPVMPASWIESASSRPRLPCGFVNVSCRARAAAMLASSSGAIAAAQVCQFM